MLIVCGLLNNQLMDYSKGARSNFRIVKQRLNNRLINNESYNDESYGLSKISYILHQTIFNLFNNRFVDCTI